MPRDPFRKCRECLDRNACRATRRILRRYFLRSDFPRTGQAWPWDYGLCPLCCLSFPFEPMEDCPRCGGTGEVAERRIRGTAAEGNQDWHDIGLMLFRLPGPQRNALEAWIYLGDIRRWRTKRIVKRLRTTIRHYRRRVCAGLRSIAAMLEQASALLVLNQTPPSKNMQKIGGDQNLV